MFRTRGGGCQQSSTRLSASAPLPNATRGTSWEVRRPPAVSLHRLGFELVKRLLPLRFLSRGFRGMWCLGEIASRLRPYQEEAGFRIVGRVYFGETVFQH